MKRHFDPLRPNRFFGVEDRYEFTHGTDSVCVYDIRTMDFVKEIAIGKRPDCHSTSADNRFLYMATGEGLFIIDQDILEVVKVVDTGHVYATNVMPDKETMLLHDAFGGVFILKNIEDMDRIHIHKRIDVHRTNTVMDTLGGKGHFIEDGRYYMVCGWERSNVFLIDLQDDYTPLPFIESDPALFRSDDLVINKDKTKAYTACHHGKSHLAVIDIASRKVIKTIPTGCGSCGLTMTNDERYVVASNDGDDSISVIDTQTDEVVATPCARIGMEKLGITGCIQGISIGVNDEAYVYGCSGAGALVRFTDITTTGDWAVSYAGGKCGSDQ